MKSGNHIVDQAERDNDKVRRCSCGSTNIVEVDWCINFGEECAHENCEREQEDCPNMTKAHICASCGQKQEE